MGNTNGISIGIPFNKKTMVLSSALLDKFLFLWSGKYSGDNLLDILNGAVISVDGKDWIGKYIPDTTSATFSVVDNALFLNADGADDFWFNNLGVVQQKTFTELIESTTLRTFIKYTDFEPYEISAIGILKTGEVITDAEKILLNKYFKLWVEYWGELMDTGYMKDNRIFNT